MNPAWELSHKVNRWRYQALWELRNPSLSAELGYIESELYFLGQDWFRMDEETAQKKLEDVKNRIDYFLKTNFVRVDEETGKLVVTEQVIDWKKEAEKLANDIVRG